jgi:hypothetical protein
MFHDLTKLSEKDLMEKILQLHKRIGQAQMFGQDLAVAQLQALVEKHQNELTERRDQAMFEMRTKKIPTETVITPSHTESKPILSKKTNGTSAPSIPSRDTRPQRSSQPVKDSYE